MTSRVFALAGLSIAALAACTHVVEGQGGQRQQQGQAPSSSTAQELPAEGEPCRCTSPAGQIPVASCCEGGLVCGDASGMPGLVRCEGTTCYRSGICVASPFASSYGSASSSSSSSSSGSGSAEPADECSPFARDDRPCPAGQECRLVGGHWGCE